MFSRAWSLSISRLDHGDGLMDHKGGDFSSLNSKCYVW